MCSSKYLKLRVLEQNGAKFCLAKGAHSEVFGVLALDIYTNICFFICTFSTWKNAFKKLLNFCLKKHLNWEQDQFFLNGLYNNLWMSRQAWEALLHLKISVELFSCSALFLPFLPRFYFYGKFWRNIEDWRIFFRLGIALIYGVAIYGRRINSNWKKVLFLKKFYDSPREKFSERRTYSFDPFYQHYMGSLWPIQTRGPSRWKPCYILVHIFEFCRILLLLPLLVMLRTFIESLAFHCLLQKCYKFGLLRIFVI